MLYAALLIGFATGMRTFTGLAAILVPRGGLVAILFALLAAGEDALDLAPQAPDRTSPPLLGARLVAAAVAGWLLAGWPGAGAAAFASLAGAFGGLRFRRILIARIGRLPAGLVESAAALVIAILAVRLPIADS